MFKIYDKYGEYRGTLVEPEAAAALIGFYGHGASVRYANKTVWIEGPDGDGEAGESYDNAADRMMDRAGIAH